MARNGSGVYNLPAGNPVVPDTTILANWANTSLSDIGVEITASLPRDGQAPMTGTLKIVDGTVSVPGLSFNGESATGLYRPGANTIALTVAGVKRIEATSSGASITGTTTSSGALTVTSGGLTVSAGGINVTGSSTFVNDIGVANVNATGIISSGSAGTGTGGAIFFKADSGTNKWREGLLGTGGAVNYSIYDVTNAAERFTINATNGVVSIAAGLAVNAGGIAVTGNSVITGTLTGITTLAVGTSATIASNTVVHAGNYTSYSPTLTGGGASGTWGISISGNAATATTASTASSVAWTNVSGRPTNVSSFTNDSGYYSNGSSPTFAQVTLTGGQIQVGSGQNEEKRLRLNNANRDVYFYLNGTTCGLYDVNSGNNRWTTDASNNFVASGNVSAYSDRRLKTDIVRIDNALDKLLACTGVTYVRKDTGEAGVGLVAQDVQLVFPQAVVECNDDQKTLSVAYGNMIGPVVEALRELKDEIEVLKDRMSIVEMK